MRAHPWQGSERGPEPQSTAARPSLPCCEAPISPFRFSCPSHAAPWRGDNEWIPKPGSPRHNACAAPSLEFDTCLSGASVSGAPGNLSFSIGVALEVPAGGTTSNAMRGQTVPEKSRRHEEASHPPAASCRNGRLLRVSGVRGGCRNR